MHGDYVEIDIDVVKILDNGLAVFVNGAEKEEYITYSLIKEGAYPLAFDVGKSYAIEVNEDLAFKRGWV